MLRLRILLPVLVVLALANVAWLTWSRWGLITINAEDRPLSEVVSAIQKQGGIILKTNADPTTKVKMNVTRVPLTEALETLATVTDMRWRLTYVFAPNKGDISGAIASFTSGQPPEGWKTDYLPVGQMPFVDGMDAPPDPRKDTWNVTTPEQKTLQAYLQEASRNVSAAFTYPEAWNPAVGKTFKSDEIADLVPKLAKAAGGKVEEVFFLQGGGRRGPDGPGEEGPPRTNEGGPRMGGMNREGMEQRMQAEIAKLPPEKRAAAQKEMNEMRSMFEGIRDLTPEQRMAKIEDIMSRPEVQERMEEREAARDARRTPEQRVQRYKRYVENKAAAKSGQPAQGGGR